MDDIARDVLAGVYGATLQQFLSDEVAKCTNQMIHENILELKPGGGDEYEIFVINNRKISFDTDYIILDVLKGEFGENARQTLHYIIRHSELLEP